MADFLPRADSELAVWSINFRDKVATDPGAVGLTQADSDELTAAVDLFISRYRLTRSGSTRSTCAVIVKDEARASMKRLIRILARKINANPDLDNATRSMLQLSVPGHGPRAQALRTPIVRVRFRAGRTVSMALKEPGTNRVGKPRAAIGAMVFWHVGPVAPTTSAGWVFLHNTTRARHTFDLPNHLPPGTKVWFAAAWLDALLQPGPWSAATPIHVPFDTGFSTANLRLAA